MDMESKQRSVDVVRAAGLLGAAQMSAESSISSKVTPRSKNDLLVVHDSVSGSHILNLSWPRWASSGPYKNTRRSKLTQTFLTSPDLPNALISLDDI